MDGWTIATTLIVGLFAVPLGATIQAWVSKKNNVFKVDKARVEVDGISLSNMRIVMEELRKENEYLRTELKEFRLENAKLRESVEALQVEVENLKDALGDEDVQ